jgi:hypothetical protein
MTMMCDPAHPSATLVANADCNAGMCVRFTATRTPTPTPALTPTLGLGIDHYRCYKAKGNPITFSATLTDVVLGDTDMVAGAKAKVAFFCDPVEVQPGTVPTPVNNVNDQLLCYIVGDTPPKFDRKTAVTVRNPQGEGQALQLISPKMVCVPSRKVSP